MTEADSKAEASSSIESKLDEVNKWLRIIALPILRESLTQALKKPEERRVYQSSDGRQVREVAESAGVGNGTVSNYWQRWARSGLVQPTSTKGRYERLVDLHDIGIEVE